MVQSSASDPYRRLCPRNVNVDSLVTPPVSASINALTLPYDFTSSSQLSLPSSLFRNTTSSDQTKTFPFTECTPPRYPISSVDNIVRRAARHIHSRSSSHKSTLRPGTATQRKAQPLFRSRLPRDLTDFLSPRRLTKTKSSDLHNEH